MEAIHNQERLDQRHDGLMEIFSSTVFRGTLKQRDGDQRFGRLKLDTATAYRLGSNNVGLFVDNCPSFERMVEHFHNLAENADSTWVIVASSTQVKENLDRMKADFCSDRHVEWPSNVIISTPEHLKNCRAEMTENLAAILVFDYACHIHKCRGCSNHRFQVANDRPQKIVDFRMSFRFGNWSPPFILFTNRKAISVNTQPMLSPYCLEAFRYIDGQTIRFGEVQNTASTTQLVAV